MSRTFRTCTGRNLGRHGGSQTASSECRSNQKGSLDASRFAPTKPSIVSGYGQ